MSVTGMHKCVYCNGLFDNYREFTMHECLRTSQMTTLTSTQLGTVDHPQHYGGADNIYETIKVVRAWGMGFSLGNAIKYISRAGKKDPTKLIEDLEKAKWYIDEEIAHIKSTSRTGGSN